MFRISNGHKHPFFRNYKQPRAFKRRNAIFFVWFSTKSNKWSIDCRWFSQIRAQEAKNDDEPIRVRSEFIFFPLLTVYSTYHYCMWQRNWISGNRSNYVTKLWICLKHDDSTWHLKFQRWLVTLFFFEWNAGS